MIIADTIMPFDPIIATVREINANPDHFVFKRVLIEGSYLVTMATIDYSDIQAPIGQGVMVDDFSDFFSDDNNVTLETIDPGATVQQLRECWVMGIVVYQTEEIVKYLDYSQPVSQAEIVAVISRKIRSECLHLLPLAKGVRRYESRPGSSAKRAGTGKLPAQEAGGRPVS